MRAWLDTQFNAPNQIDLIGADGRVRRTFVLLDLKKIDGPVSAEVEVDYRNEPRATRRASSSRRRAQTPAIPSSSL